MNARQPVDLSCGIELANGIPAVTDPTRPHDALFKRTFSDPLNASGELRAMLPAALVAATDFSTLELCSGSFIDETLANSESDLLFQAKVASRDAYFYILFEHQSQPDPLMPLRMLRYVVRVLERHVAAADGKAASLPLPPVIPLVLHHGDTGWNVARRAEDLFDPDLIAQTGIGELIPRMTMLVDDLADRSDEDLALRGAGGPRAVVTLHLFRDRGNASRFRASQAALSAALGALLTELHGREELQVFLHYAVHGASTDVGATLVDAAAGLDPQAKEELMTLAEKWMAEGEAKGKAEGEAKGKAEGEAKGKAELLHKLASLKFGPLPEGIAERFERATIAELDTWAERVLTASTLEAMLED